MTVRAQDGLTVISDEEEHVFQEAITFRLTASSSSPINAIALFYRVSGQTSSNKEVLEFAPDTEVEVEHVLDMSDQDNYEPPMASFTYWWVIEDQAGNRLKTDAVTFVYSDTRYEWQVLHGDRVWLYWHDQAESFGQRYYDLATGAAQDLSVEFGVQPKDPASIVIYNSHDELMSVLQEASAEWTGAVTFGDSGIIAIGLGSAEWMEAVIPHELTHAMLSQVTKPPFGEIPRWLDEGLAVRSEGGSSSEELLVLARAIEDDDLISLRVLNSSFADQRERAVLSYAESYSLVDFIISEYGADKLGELIAVFAEGAHYDDAMMQVFGVDMDGMEDLWREHIGAAPREGVTRATPVPTATFTPSPTPTEALESPNQTPVSTPTAVVAAPTATATPVAVELTATPTPQPAVSGGPCLGAASALALVALFVVCRPRPR